MRLQSLRFISCLLLVSLLWGGMMSASAQDDPISGRAYISTASVRTTDEGTFLDVTGELADPCTEISAVEQTRAGTRLLITIETERDPDLMCATVLQPFEDSYELNTADLEPGEYTLVINELEVPWAYQTATAQAETRRGCPAPGPRQTLIDAPRAGLCFVAPEGFVLDQTEDGLSVRETILLAFDVDPLVMPIEVLTDSGPAEVTALAEALDDPTPLSIAGGEAISSGEGFAVGFIVARRANYVYAFGPVALDSEQQGLRRRAEALWQALRASLTLYDPIEDVETFTLGDLGVSFDAPANWETIDGALELQVGLQTSDGDIVLMFRGLSADFAGEATAVETLLAETFGVSPSAIRPATLGADALPVLAIATSSECRVYFVPSATVPMTLMVSAEACDAEKNIEQAGLRLALATLRFSAPGQP